MTTEARDHTIKFAADLPVDLFDAVDEYHRKTGVQKRRIMELALRRFLVEEARKEAGA